MVRRLGLGKNNHLTYASLALNPRFVCLRFDIIVLYHFDNQFHGKVSYIAGDNSTMFSWRRKISIFLAEKITPGDTNMHAHTIHAHAYLI